MISATVMRYRLLSSVMNLTISFFANSVVEQILSLFVLFVFWNVYLVKKRR